MDSENINSQNGDQYDAKSQKGGKQTEAPSRSSKDIRRELHKVSLEGTPDEVRDFYNDISECYDEYNSSLGKDTGAMNLAKAIERVQPNKKARILDVASGTGLLGVKLKELGYTEVDGLDPAQRMLDVSKAKGVYNKYICASVEPDKKTQLSNNTYDVVCVNGSFTSGLITPGCLPELTRIAKPGGTLAFSATAYYVKNITEFGEDAIEAKLQSFVDDGKWTAWTKETHVYFAATGEEAIAYIAAVA